MNCWQEKDFCEPRKLIWATGKSRSRAFRRRHMSQRAADIKLNNFLSSSTHHDTAIYYLMKIIRLTQINFCPMCFLNRAFTLIKGTCWERGDYCYRNVQQFHHIVSIFILCVIFAKYFVIIFTYLAYVEDAFAPLTDQYSFTFFYVIIKYMNGCHVSSWSEQRECLQEFLVLRFFAAIT